jgi:hypothetical protein
MNIIESIIYNLVKNNPVLKQRIVDAYQGLFSIIPQKKIIASFPVVERKGFYYGFHDKSPFSSDGQMLLSHKVLTAPRKKKPDDKIGVGFFKGENWMEYVPLAQTTGWNWQMGSMLQWHGVSNDRLVYNAMDGQQHISVVHSVNGELICKYPWPVVHVSPDQKFACSYNFHRAEAAMPGYGIVTDQPEIGEGNNNFFRIFSCDTGAAVFEISLDEATSIAPHESMKGAFHFFHHALFNPGSNRVFFLHRWLDKNQRRWTRMFSVGTNGMDLYLFPMDEMVSHITWASASEIFSYLRYPQMGDGYYLVEDQSGKCTRYFSEVLNSDGHPTMDKERGIVITDTYPDRFRNQYLVLCSIENGKRTNLCRTHLPLRFKGDLQVDLHPRLHPFRSIACADSAHNGVHSLLTIDFTNAYE